VLLRLQHPRNEEQLASLPVCFRGFALGSDEFRAPTRCASSKEGIRTWLLEVLDAHSSGQLWLHGRD